MRFQSLCFMLVVVLLSGCSAIAPPTPIDSGVMGQAVVGPMCPVMIEGGECPDQPYQATITILNRGGKQIIQFQTDKQGKFRVPLAPGEYVLRPETPPGMPFPFADQQEFTVLPDGFTPIIVSYDSGIR